MTSTIRIYSNTLRAVAAAAAGASAGSPVVASYRQKPGHQSHRCHVGAASVRTESAASSSAATAEVGLAVAAFASGSRFAWPRWLKRQRGRILQAECEELPVYTRAEVAKHTSAATGVWVTYKGEVYDISKFIKDHPGGDRIMLAAGKDIGPFWRLYQLHEQRGNALRMLEPLRIGHLSSADVESEKADVGAEDDPYRGDPARHPCLLYHSTKPGNAELPSGLIMDNWITPSPLWFIRNHHPVPHVDPAKFRILVEGRGMKALTMDLDDIQRRFTPHEVTCTIQCGGNRRSEFNVIHETSGISWGNGAMSTAVFKGALLRDVLQFAGLMTPQSAEADGVRHVIFHGLDDMQASVPIEKALSPYGEALLAYEMNGEPLPPEHGFPVRVVVPGHVGVRNVKWVARICTSDEEAEGTWQRGIAYKGLAPSIKSLQDFTPEELAKVQSVQEQPVTSMIIEPTNGTLCELDDITVRGFAWSGGGRGIVRVDVTADGGKTWHSAALKEGTEQHPTRAWAWTFWECDVPKPQGLKDGDTVEICAKAIDVAYNTQPDSVAHIWNLRGINNNSWPRVKVKHIE